MAGYVFCSKDVAQLARRFPTDMKALVLLVQQDLNLENQVTIGKQASDEVARKLQMASSAVLSPQHRALARAEEE